jgi:ribosomal protein S18 acetylase RimI-like enzyme
MKQISSNLKVGIRSAVREDRQRLANLLHFEYYVHRHLDWVSPLDLITEQPFLVLEQDNQIHAALACPEEPPGASWIRLFAASGAVSYEAAWQFLWAEVRERQREHGKTQFAAIALHKWFADMLERSRYEHIQDVIFLMWEYDHRPDSIRKNQSAVIRPMSIGDLLKVAEIDQAAFGLIWQNSVKSLGFALEQSHIATVAQIDNQLVGYQISTAGHMGGHLARLAVHPNYQGRGVGLLILKDLLQQFTLQQIYRVTVNTQSDNYASLNLYEKLGFRKTGEEYAVFDFQT